MSAIVSDLTSTRAMATGREVSRSGDSGFARVLAQLQPAGGTAASTTTDSDTVASTASAAPADQPGSQATSTTGSRATASDTATRSPPHARQTAGDRRPQAPSATVDSTAAITPSAQLTPDTAIPGDETDARTARTDPDAKLGDKTTAQDPATASTDGSALALLLQWSPAAPPATPGDVVSASGKSTASGNIDATTATGGAAHALQVTPGMSSEQRMFAPASTGLASDGTSFAATLGAAPASIDASGTAAAHGDLTTADSSSSQSPLLASLQDLSARGQNADSASSATATDSALAALQQSASVVSAPAAPATAAAPAATVTVQMNSPDFASQLSQNLTMLVSQDVQQARIQVSPQGLGPIDIQLHVSNGVVDVNFAVQHPSTVHAIQQTLPQLDSLMSNQGLQLGQAQVGQQSQHSAGRAFAGDSGQRGGADTSGHALDTASEAVTQVVLRQGSGRGMVDHFV